MSVELQGVEQLDFSGGMSDFLAAPEKTQVEKLENWEITEEKKPLQRPGSNPIDGTTYASANTNRSTIAERIQRVVNFKNDSAVLLQAKDKIFSWKDTTLSEVQLDKTSPSKAFSSAKAITANSISQAFSWRDHVLFTAFDPSTGVILNPKKVWQKDSSTFACLDASIEAPGELNQRSPTPLYDTGAYFYGVCDFANTLLTAVNTHFSNVTWHSSADTNTLFPLSGVLTEDDLIQTTLDIVDALRQHIEDARKTSTSYHSANTSGTKYFGNFELRRFSRPLNFRECIPILNEAAFVLDMHHMAFEISNFSARQHSGVTTGIVGSTYKKDENLAHWDVISKFVDPDAYLQTLIPTTLAGLVKTQNLHISDWYPTSDIASPGGHSGPTPTTGITETYTGAPVFKIWRALFQMIIGYVLHINDLGAHSSIAVTGSEKLSSFPELADLYQKQYEGFLHLVDPYSAAGFIYFIDLYQELYSKLNTHIGVARHTGGPITGGLLTYSEAIRYPTEYTLGVVKFALTYSNKYLDVAKTEFYDESSPHYVTYRALFSHLEDETRSQFGTTPGYRINGVGYSSELPYFGALTNPGGQPDLGNTLINVYRTQANGESYYKIASGNPTTIFGFQDTFLDSEITAYEELYTNGGVASNDPVPLAKTSTLLENVSYFGCTTDLIGTKFMQGTAVSATDRVSLNAQAFPTDLSEGDIVAFFAPVGASAPAPFDITVGGFYVRNISGSTFQVSATPTGSILNITGDGVIGLSLFKKETVSNRVRQSLLTTPFYSPQQNYVDLASEVKVLGHARGYPLAVCARGVYRLEGQIDSFGSGTIIPRLISDKVFGIGHQSGITVNDIFYFAAIDGFYMCDGFSVKCLSAHLRPSFLDRTTQDQSQYSAKNENIQAAYNPITNLILWTMTTAGTTPDEIWALHLDHIQDGKGCFSKYTNGAEFKPTALEFYKGNLLRATDHGFLFHHDLSLTSDPRITSNSLQSDGSIELVDYIPLDIKTHPRTFGSFDKKKVQSRFDVLAYPAQKLTLDLVQENDLSNVEKSLKPIVYTDSEYKGLIRERRAYSASSSNSNSKTGLRAVMTQLELKSRLSVLAKSDSLGLATVSGTSVTIATGPLPQQLKGCAIYFNNSTTPYTISSRVSGTQLTLSASAGTLTNASYEIWGYPVDEKPQLIGIIDRLSATESQAFGGQEGVGGNG